MNTTEGQTNAEKKTSRLELAKRAFLASTAGIVALAVSACTPGGNAGAGKSEVAEIPKAPEYSIEVEATDAAIDAAGIILDILEAEGSGAEAYNGNMIGNKKAVIGPDGVFPSDDDNLNPESFVGFNAETDQLYFNSVAGEFVNEQFFYTSNFVVFHVDENSPLQFAGEPDINDYRAALESSDALTLEELTVYMPDANLRDELQGSIKRDEKGNLIPTAGIGVLEGDQLEPKGGESDEAAKNAAQRILQIVDASSRGLEEEKQ